MNHYDVELSFAESVKRLREILVVSEPMSDEQKEQASKRAGLVFTALQREDVASLEWLLGLSLLARARKLGIPGSKNRLLPVARLSESAPCALHSLPDVTDQSLAIEALSKVRASWCDAYIYDYIKHENADVIALPDLLRWLRGINNEPVHFLISCLDQIANVKKLEIRGLMVKILAKQAALLVAQDQSQAIEAIHHFSDTAKKLLSEENLESNFSAPFFDVLIAYVDNSRLRFPLLVLDIQFLHLVRKTADNLNPGLVKVWEPFLQGLGASAVSCLSEILKIASDSVADHARAMIPLISSAYPEFSNYVKKTHHLAILLESKGSDIEDRNDDAIVHAFGRLLPTWDDFLFAQPEKSMFVELDNLLKDAAGAVNIIYLGERNQLISYDPLHHSLTEDENSVPTQVKVIRPGAAIRRPDGSVRVILPALVSGDIN